MTLFAFGAITPVVGALFLTTETAFAQTLPLKVGMNYEEAREKLVEQGWQPHVPSGFAQLSCDGRDPCTYVGLDNSEEAERSFINLQIALRKVFRDRGWFETVHCFPSGAGFCHHSYTNPEGRELLVQTGSGAYKEMPSVIKFWFSE